MKYGIYGDFASCADYSNYIAVTNSYIKALEEISRLTQTKELEERGLYYCYIIELEEKEGIINLENYSMKVLHEEDMRSHIFIRLEKERKKYKKHEKISGGFCVVGYGDEDEQIILEKVYTDLEPEEFFSNDIIFKYWCLKYFPNENFEDIKKTCIICESFKSKNTPDFIIASFDSKGITCTCADD